MSRKSFIYSHIAIYRFFMQVLYLGRYRQRFSLVINQLAGAVAGTRILELCFGDIYIAEYCNRTGLQWLGMDINEHFVKKAQALGFDAHYADLTLLNKFPASDVCIMMGSFYHFHVHANLVLTRMAQSAEVIIISEPVFNLSNAKGIIGFLAKRAANAGKGNEEFRYNETTFTALLNENAKRLNLTIVSKQRYGKDIIVKLVKNGKHKS